MSPKAAPRGAAWYIGYALFAAMLAGVAILFYFGGFIYLLSNESSSFAVERCLAESRAHSRAAIAVLGNSTAAEDFRPNWFNARSPSRTAVNLGVPGGHLYLFERILAQSMRDGLHPRTIVLLVTPEVLSLRPDFDYLQNDLTMLKTVLDSTDFARLAAHSRNPYDYAAHASYIAARPVLFRGDLRDLMTHPVERVHEAATVRQWLHSFGPSSPMSESDNNFSVCEIGPLAQLPQTIAALPRQGRAAQTADYERVEAAYAPRVHQPLRVDAFETTRFRRVLADLASIAPVYVIPAPYYDPAFEQYPASYRQSAAQAIRDVTAAVHGVTLLPEFPAGCQMFFDTVHLNRTGAEQFTEYLRTRVI